MAQKTKKPNKIKFIFYLSIPFVILIFVIITYFSKLNSGVENPALFINVGIELRKLCQRNPYSIMCSNLPIWACHYGLGGDYHCHKPVDYAYGPVPKCFFQHLDYNEQYTDQQMHDTASGACSYQFHIH